MPRAHALFVTIGVVLLVAACSTGASSTTPEPTGTAMSVASPAGTVTPPSCPTLTPEATPTPYPTSAADIDPKAPAAVYGTQQNGSIKEEGTLTKTETGYQLRGYMETVDLALSDPRVSGPATFRYEQDSYEGEGGADVKIIGGDMRIDGPDGSWEGPCRGSMWVYKEWDTACWLSGTGAYEGMTFLYDLIHIEPGDLLVRGAIYPGPVPD